MKTFFKLFAFMLLTTLCAAEFTPIVIRANDISIQSANDDMPINSIASDELTAPVIARLKNKSGGVYISWTEVKGADYYRIYRKKPFETEWKELTDTDSNEYLDQSMHYMQGIVAAYKIRAFKSGGSVMSPTSAAQSIFRLEKPGVVCLRVVNAKSGIKIYYNIGNRGTNKGIIIYRKGPGETSYVRIAKVRATAEDRGSVFVDSNVEEGKAYSYRICLYNGGTKSCVSKERTLLRVDSPKLSLKKTNSGVKLTWTNVPEAAGYQLYTCKPEETVFAYYSDTTETSYLEKSFADDTGRAYKVRAYYYNGEKKEYGVFSSAKVIG